MSFNVAMLRAMQAEGLSLEACIRILEAAAPPVDTAADKRRAYDRERKREQREAQKSGGMSGGNPPDPSPNERDNLTPTREEKPETKVSAKKSGFSAPNGVGDGQWSAFRKQRKKPLNERSYTLLCGKLAKLAEDGWPPGEMIDLAIERGWETVFEPRNFNDRRTNGMAGNQSDGLSPTTRAAIAVFGPGTG